MLLSSLVFADDLLLLTDSAAKLQSMLVQLKDSLATLGLKINFTKCRWASNCPSDATISVGGTVVPGSNAGEVLPFL
eukprot:9153864-Heterocapsa_arctica.AAC.1